MFWYKKITALLFVSFLVLILSSCDNKKVTVTYTIADTTKINFWKKNHDSLFTQYQNSGDPSFIQQAGPYADSLLQINKQVLNDTNYRKIYTTVLFYRASGLDVLANHIKSRELFDKYLYLYDHYHLSNAGRLAYARKTLGNIYSRYGDYKKAVLLLQQCLAYYNEKKDTTEIASCIINLSIPLKELQRYDEAEQILQKIFQLNSLPVKRKAIACTELADIFTRQNKISDAGSQIKNAKQFLALMPHAPDRTEAYAGLHNIEGNWLMVNYKPADALKAYQQSLDSATILSGQNLRSREIGKLYIAMGKALEQLKQYDPALNYYNKALYCVVNIDTLDKFSLPLQKDIYAENTIAEALYAKANCIINSGMESERELENAVSSFKLAFETESKLLQGFSYDESRMYMQEETRKQTEKAIAVCFKLYQKTKNSRWANEAFFFAENNKAFVLAESVRRNTAASTFLQQDTLYKNTRILQNNLAWIEIEMSKQLFLANPDTALINSLSVTKQSKEEELLAAENNIRIKNPQYANQITGRREFSAEELLNKTLTGDNRLIEYFTGDSSLYVFSAEKSKPLGFYMLPATVKNNTADFLHFFLDRNLILNDPAGYAVAANGLYNSLLGPYMAKSNTPLLIIPDGFISYIPFDALLTDSTTSTGIASFPFLIKQQENYYAFSCKTLLEQQQYKNTGIENSVTAFAPIFADKERGLAPLIQSTKELDAIKQFYPTGKFYTANNATLKQFEATCGDAEILHLATHAGASNGSAIAGIEFYDSTLYLNRIYSLPLKARLVVLSGCETGIGAINKTEGLMSLARAFSYAGTKNVIAGLWQTEDNTSSEIFTSFYSNLSDNNFSSALHKAKLAVINNATVTSASPFYWSGYVYIGSPEEHLQPASNKKIKWLLLMSGLLLIAVYVFYRKKKN
ncbi:MAG: CHAT domain-containing tetratricopeptide repeat protein [Ferruginibacter sp.]